MDKVNIMSALADVFEVEEKDIIPQKELIEYEAWDSVAVLSIVSLYTDYTGKFISADEVLKARTIRELIQLLGE